MKKYLIILFLIFISSTAFTQWTGEVNLSQFTVQSQSQLSACVDANGIHLVYWRNGGIKYARANYNGSTVYYSDRVIEAEGSNCDFVNIVSVNNSTLYAIYKKNNTINVKRSVNLGSSWSQYSSRPMTNTGCNKIVAYSEGSDIHIGWTEYKGNPDYHYESYYIKFQTSPIQWSYYKEVTDQESSGGNNPDLTISANKIHYTYLAQGFYSKSRDKIKTSPDWQNSMDIPFSGSFIKYQKPVIANNNVNAALRVYYSFWQTSGAFISNSDRPFDQGFWNENVWLRESEVDYDTEVESTIDNKIHFIYYDKYDIKWEHRYLTGSTLSDQIGEIPLVAFPSSTLIANSNDLYLLALGSIDIPSWIKLQRYDMAPGAPTGLTITEDANNHPRLNWNASPEPDKNYYNIYRYDYYGGGWQYLAQSTGNTYTDQTLTYCHAIPPLQCPDLRNFSFRVTVVDNGSHESSPSNEVTARLVGDPPSKAGANDPNDKAVFEYALGQNYPNPFNPTTTINYSLKSAGEVTLKVYDMLGIEVASIVNERQETGNYSVEFNAANLPSGIYVYRLSTNNFVDTKKLILLK
ncbi:MAG: T9SS type A sorting domain-containing protein [Ignavibacteriaceae bacterium]|nr:T9SS type A sorting domain-containing protein [Ignavibacteriaceae bacterium]